MAGIGYFNEVILEVANAINLYSIGNTIEVKHLRRTMNVDRSNRSKIIFLVRALNYFNHETILKVNAKVSPKQYMIIAKIEVEMLREMMESNKNGNDVCDELSKIAIIPVDDEMMKKPTEPFKVERPCYKKTTRKKIKAHPIPEIIEKVDKVTEIVLWVMARFKVYEEIAVRDIIRRLDIPNNTRVARRIAMFISRIFYYLEQESVVENANHRNTRTFTIVKDIDPEKLSKNVALKCPKVVNSDIVLEAAFVLI